MTQGLGTIAQLQVGEGLEEFQSGRREIDNWAHRFARGARNRGDAVVYVLKVNGIAMGFYALCAHSVERSSIAGGSLRRNAPNAVPVLLLGMLGVEDSEQGKGYGKRLLADAIRRSVEVASMIGLRALVVDPLDDEVSHFYTHYGFRWIPGTTRLFLPLKRRGA